MNSDSIENDSIVKTVPATLRIGGAIVDLSRREIRRSDGLRWALSSREAALLGYLAKRSGQTVSRATLLAHVWNLDPRGTVTRTVDMHISLLRKKLGVLRRGPEILRTVHGVGYQFLRPAASLLDPTQCADGNDFAPSSEPAASPGTFPGHEHRT